MRVSVFAFPVAYEGLIAAVGRFVVDAPAYAWRRRGREERNEDRCAGVGREGVWVWCDCPMHMPRRGVGGCQPAAMMSGSTAPTLTFDLAVPRTRHA